MSNIVVGRYTAESGSVQPDGSVKQTWAGWIEPEDKTWIAFIDMDGNPTFYLNRDPVTGGIIG